MIELTDWLKAELIRRAEADAPEECCGLISRAPAPDGGSPGPIHLWAAENAHERPRDEFLIDPANQLAILRAIEKQGHELVGIYHSHPRTPPDPSPTDRVYAEGWPDVTWVIVGFPPCPRGCKGTTDAHCPVCKDWGYVPSFWAGLLP